KAMQVRADELVRKPFQPQDLIARVKSLLNPGSPTQRGSLRAEETHSPPDPQPLLRGPFCPGRPTTIERASKLRPAEFRVFQSRHHVRMARGTRANFRAATHRASTRASRSTTSTRGCSAAITRRPKTAPRNSPPRAPGEKTAGRIGSPKTILRRPGSRLQIHA